MRRKKLILCFSIIFSISLFFFDGVSARSSIKTENEQSEGINSWPGGTYSPKLLSGMNLDNARKELAGIFGGAQRVDDNAGFKLSGALDINNPFNKQNLTAYLKLVQAYMIVRDPGGEFKYMLSRSGISVQEDHIHINPGFKLFFIDLVDRPLTVQKIGVEDIRCSWPDVNWNLVNDTIAGKHGIKARPMYKRPFMIRCGNLVSLFFKSSADAEKAADALFSIQKGLEKTLADRRTNLESLAPQYRELTIKPSVSEEQRKNIVLADMMRERKDYLQAISLYIKVIKFDPVSYPEAYFNLALLSEQMKRYNMAVYYMKLYLMLIPDGPDSRNARDRIYEWDYMFKEKQ